MMNLTGKAGENQQIPTEGYYIISTHSSGGLGPLALIKLLPVYSGTNGRRNSLGRKESSSGDEGGMGIGLGLTILVFGLFDEFLS